AMPAQAFFRMPCGQNIVTERADPIISPGVVSAHVHQVNGGNGFGFTLDYAAARKSTCTSCTAKADLSNYWTPILYYQDQQGKFTKVGQNGMTVYYLQRGTNTNITAFPENFRMIAGDPFKRSFSNDFAGQAVSFVCLDYSGSGAGGEWNYLPDHACPDGIRAQVFFPSCWDGKNTDSADHKSHVVYPESGSYNGGTCPSSHPVQLVSIFFEVIFDTSKFTFWQGTSGTKQPFVFGMGDPTGYGFHGDFVNGWDIPTLQKAVDTCTNDSGTMEDCHALELNTGDEMAACTIPSSVNEDITGPLDKLPGCNAVNAGPGEVTPSTDCATTPISGPQIPFTDVTSLGWAYQGCANDDVNSRTLTGTSNIYSTNQATTDVETCIKSCLGSTYAGLEYGKQCFCGNSVATDRLPQASQLGACNMPCAGNSSQVCGGGSQLSLYK
ncbi:putative WSC domain protein, partial [Myriangium duriaei CBS 260.36]